MECMSVQSGMHVCAAFLGLVRPLALPICPHHQVDDGALELYDQAGRRVPVTTEDKKALVMGLALHDNGRAALKQARKEREWRGCMQQNPGARIKNRESGF